MGIFIQDPLQKPWTQSYVLRPNQSPRNLPALGQLLLQGIRRLFCITYHNAILIFFVTLDEHRVHIQKDFPTLCNKIILLKSKKYDFHTQSTTYLGLIISREGLSMNPGKVHGVKECNTPRHRESCFGTSGLWYFLLTLHLRHLLSRYPTNCIHSPSFKVHFVPWTQVYQLNKCVKACEISCSNIAIQYYTW